MTILKQFRSQRGIAALAVLCAFPAFATDPARSVAALPDLQIEKMLDSGTNLWALSTDGFLREFGGQGFRWTSETKTTARAYKAPVKFLQWPVIEALAEFTDSRMARLTLVFYSRGDVGGMAFDNYRATVGQLGSALNALTETKTPAEVKSPITARGVRMQSFAWVKPPHQFIAEWSHSEISSTLRQPEFIRLRIEPFDPAKDPRSAMATAAAAISAARKGSMTQAELRRNIAHDENGDVLIQNVPMVDQGPKGYCAVATTERIMSYYGLEADQHVMAQLAQSSAQGGTSLEAMVGSLRALGPKLGCRVREVIELDLSSLERLAKRYDREAKRADKPASHWTPPVIDITDFFSSMDKQILLDLKAQEADAKRLPARVKESIDKGIPLTWGVMLGIVPENPAIPQSKGGHLRIIVGYNLKTNEVLYSDSWGRGHELKRMPFASAWAITVSLYAIEPRHLTL